MAASVKGSLAYVQWTLRFMQREHLGVLRSQLCLFRAQAAQALRSVWRMMGERGTSGCRMGWNHAAKWKLECAMVPRRWRHGEMEVTIVPREDVGVGIRTGGCVDRVEDEWMPSLLRCRPK